MKTKKYIVNRLSNPMKNIGSSYVLCLMNSIFTHDNTQMRYMKNIKSINDKETQAKKLKWSRILLKQILNWPIQEFHYNLGFAILSFLHTEYAKFIIIMKHFGDEWIL